MEDDIQQDVLEKILDAKKRDLWDLDLRSTQITTIPDEIGILTNLQVLDLYYNQITTIPDAIGNLTNLQYLNLSNNPIHAQHQHKSTRQIIQYYKNAAHREYCLIYLSLAMECSYPVVAAVRDYWASPE